MKASSYRPENLRNIVLLGHGGAGKTSLVEAVLLKTGAITRPGSIEQESTASDHEPEARRHHHSTSSSLLFATHEGVEINILDTPGHPEFVGSALASLCAVETAVIVVNAATGVEFNTRRLFHAAGEAGLARMVVVNKLDLAPARLPNLLAELTLALGSRLLPINLPTPGLDDVVDVFERETGKVAFGSVKEAHRALVEAVVEGDDLELERYLSGAALTAASLRATFVRAMKGGQVVPVLFTSAKSGAGIAALLHVLVNEAPSPLSGRTRRVLKNGELVEIACDPDAPLLAHVFKVTADPHGGQVAMLRVLQGSLSATTPFVGASDQKARKATHLLKVEGREHVEFDSVAWAGDLVALARIEELHVDQLLHAPEVKAVLVMPRPKYPTPMLSLAVSNKAKADDVKVGQALARLAEEDPTFSFKHDPVTGELVLSGLGEEHLKVMLERLQNRSRVAVVSHAPTIPYRETIGTVAEGHYRHRKQTGGAGQFAEVFLRLEPLPRGHGFEFASEVFGGAIPGQFLPSVEKGVHDALERGVLAGFPVFDLRVVVTDGKTHSVDSKDIAFRTAAKWAVRDALPRARPALLEPVGNLEVTAPEEYMGAITGEMKGIRGRILGMEALPGGLSVVRALAPLAELRDFAGTLRGVTGGHGTFTVELAQYEPVPQHTHNKLFDARAAHRTQEEEP
ncbi:MAG: elongation factor G [Archangium sp.]|nr:elongation factor G [Archangium sp.]MDP3574684.1 elongation factor G [Archangium sp.]